MFSNLKLREHGSSLHWNKKSIAPHDMGRGFGTEGRLGYCIYSFCVVVVLYANCRGHESLEKDKIF